MRTQAKLSYLRIAPRKVRLVADLIRRKRVSEAQTLLRYTINRAAHPLLKLLNSAVTNAEHNFQLDRDNLYIAKITVDEGPRYKRWMPRARGSASPIHKKTSHVLLVLDEMKADTKAVKKETAKVIQPTEVKEGQEVREAQREQKDFEAPKYKSKSGLKTKALKPGITGGIKRFFRRKSV